MKTKQITILKKLVLLVDGLPSGVKFQITEEGILIYEVDGVKEVLHNVPPIKEFVSTLKDLTEEQTAELVESIPFASTTVYKCYNNPDAEFHLWAMCSFFSGLDADGVLFKNPISDKPNILRDSENSWSEEQYKDWQAAESKVFSENTLIFIIDDIQNS